MNAQRSTVFTPARIGPLQIKNRLVRSATGERAATEKGEVSDALVNVYRDLAKGGVGLIISGVTAADSRSVGPSFMRADDDSFIPGLARIPRAVKESAPDCKVMLQLVHFGRQIADEKRAAKLMRYLPPAFLGWVSRHPEVMAHQSHTPSVPPETVAPSSVFDSLFDSVPRALTLKEIDSIVNAFVSAICRAKEAGFDGVQLHAAHGYLLSTFLSPKTNQRQDDYGGSIENRARIITEIYTQARKKVGKDFPILIKMNLTDFLPGGMNTDEAIQFARIFSHLGFGAIETSGGMWESVTRPKDELGFSPVLLPESRTGIKEREQEAYFLSGARALKETTKATIILVGGLRSLSRIDEILASGAADFAALCRPLIRQPDLPQLWQSGKGSDKADCISCNACISLVADRFFCRVIHP